MLTLVVLTLVQHMHRLPINKLHIREKFASRNSVEPKFRLCSESVYAFLKINITKGG